MTPTIEFIKHCFDRFNLLMFRGRLPAIPIRLTNARTYLGQCVSRIISHPDGRKEHTDFELRFSTLHNLTTAQIEDTVIHEMIHYFIHYNGLVDSSAHGPIFRSIMHSINVAHGRMLTISHKAESHAETTERNVGTGRWHIIAILHLNGGDRDKVGIKVLPRSGDKVIEFYRRVMSSGQVDNIDLYLHNHPYFDRFPTSAALRYHPASLRDISQYLTGARLLTINGNRLE